MTKGDNLLACLAEECFELGKEVTKALRFGLYDKWKENPIPHDSIPHEFYDIMGVIEMLYDAGILERPTDEKIQELIKRKKERVEYFMEYSKKLNRVEE